MLLHEICDVVGMAKESNQDLRTGVGIGIPVPLMFHNRSELIRESLYEPKCTAKEAPGFSKWSFEVSDHFTKIDGPYNNRSPQLSGRCVRVGHALDSERRCGLSDVPSFAQSGGGKARKVMNHLIRIAPI
jgi:hypothetical protein